MAVEEIFWEKKSLKTRVENANKRFRIRARWTSQLCRTLQTNMVTYLRSVSSWADVDSPHRSRRTEFRWSVTSWCLASVWRHGDYVTYLTGASWIRSYTMISTEAGRLIRVLQIKQQKENWKSRPGGNFNVCHHGLRSVVGDKNSLSC